jgi:hypothetical protein
MSADGSKFFVMHPSLRIFCEWNRECPDDVFARYHIIDCQVRVNVAVLKLELVLGASFAFIIPGGDAARTCPYNFEALIKDNMHTASHKQDSEGFDSNTSPSPSCVGHQPTARAPLVVFGTWHRDPWRKWLGSSTGMPYADSHTAVHVTLSAFCSHSVLDCVCPVLHEVVFVTLVLPG